MIPSFDSGDPYASVNAQNRATRLFPLPVSGAEARCRGLPANQFGL